MYDSVSFTPEEFYKINGAVREKDLDKLFDAPDVREDLSAVKVYASEARAQYPAEDFLEDIKTRLWALHKNLRGNNKETLQNIIEALDDLAQCTFYATEEGRSNLHNITQIVEKYDNTN